MNGIPHNAIFEIIIAAVVIGRLTKLFPNWRKSCEWENWRIRLPAQINKRALKIAWVKRWKKVKFVWPRERLVIIKPNWLKVDRAIIFFISNSVIALILAIIMVIEAKIDNIFGNKVLWDRIGQNRNNKKTPAVTKVEECTKAETGVGAAIAAGNQEEKGIWALFVIPAIIINIIKRLDGLLKDCVGNQFIQLNISIRDTKIITSPIRLIRTVINPELRAFGVW